MTTTAAHSAAPVPDARSTGPLTWAPTTRRAPRPATGSASRATTFHTPVTAVNRPMPRWEKPYCRAIAQVTPTPTAPPKGTRLDTPLPTRLRTKPWPLVRPGSEAARTNEYAHSPSSHSPVRAASCQGLTRPIAPMADCHEAPVTLGRTTTISAARAATEAPTWRRRPGERPRRRLG